MASSKSSVLADVVEIGNFEDLQTLVGLLNQTFGKKLNYRLDEVQGQKGIYLFIEDPIGEDEYECGLVAKKGKKAYAFSSGVHAMILGAYQRYVEATC